MAIHRAAKIGAGRPAQQRPKQQGRLGNPPTPRPRQYLVDPERDEGDHVDHDQHGTDDGEGLQGGEGVGHGEVIGVIGDLVNCHCNRVIVLSP